MIFNGGVPHEQLKENHPPVVTTRNCPAISKEEGKFLGKHDANAAEDEGSVDDEAKQRHT